MNSRSVMLAAACENAPGCVGRVEAAAQRLDDSRAQRLPFALGAGVQQRDAPRQMIEHEQRFGCDVHGLGQTFELRGRCRATARRSARRHSRSCRRGRRRTGCRRFPDAASARGRARRASARATRRRSRAVWPALPSMVSRSACSSTVTRLAQADERVARQAFTALDAFEQEARAERFELHVRRYRGIEIGGDVER